MTICTMVLSVEHMFHGRTLYVYEPQGRTKQVTDNIQHLKEEDGDFYSDDDLFKISSWGVAARIKLPSRAR